MKVPLSLLLYWVTIAFAIVLTGYLEIRLGSEDWTLAVLIIALGFLVWSVGLGLSTAFAKR